MAKPTNQPAASLDWRLSAMSGDPHAGAAAWAAACGARVGHGAVPAADAVEAALRSVGPGRVWLCEARDGNGWPRAVAILCSGPWRAWEVLATVQGPAWLIEALSDLRPLLSALPSGVRCIAATGIGVALARQAEALPSWCEVRWARRPGPRPADEAPVEHEYALRFFRDDPSRLLHRLTASLRAGWWPAAAPRLAPGARVVRTLDPSQADSRIWALLDAADRESVQDGSAWLRHFCATVDLQGGIARLHVLYDGELPLAVWPVINPPRRPGGEVAALANYYTSLYAPSLSPGLYAEDLVPLLSHALRDAGGAAAIRLAPMDGAGRAFALMRDAMRAAGLVVFEYPCFGNWYLPAAGYDWAGYLATRSAGLRSTLKRLGAKFETEQQGRMELIEGGCRLEAGIDAYERVYRQSWKVPEPHPRFMPGLMRACADRGWLRLGVAWAGEQPAAAQFWIVANGRADIFKVAYDDAFARYSVGSLLTGFLMRHVLEDDRVQEVDFLMGDDAYKRGWMDARRERWGMVAYRPWSLPGMAGIARRIGALLRDSAARPDPGEQGGRPASGAPSPPRQCLSRPEGSSA